MVDQSEIPFHTEEPANESWKIIKLANNIASRAVSPLEGVGVFAVELFLTQDGEGNVYSHVPSFIDMPKQRKIGHITIVGPSMEIVEAQVKIISERWKCKGYPG
ncbi:phosphoribosylaminoimidazole carboxylase, chloroplastic isoform X1, partial [Tanacetum coccineum]